MDDESSSARAEPLKQCTKQFGLRVLRLVDQLPRSIGAQTIGRQLVPSATSVGANYRAAGRARSPSEFRAKLGIVEEEIDESAFWIEMLIEAEYIRAERLQDLLNEAHEITAMVVASIRTSRRNERSGREDGAVGRTRSGKQHLDE